LLPVPDKIFTRLLKDNLSDQWFTIYDSSSKNGYKNHPIFHSAQNELPYNPGIFKKINSILNIC